MVAHDYLPTLLFVFCFSPRCPPAGEEGNKSVTITINSGSKTTPVTLSVPEKFQDANKLSDGSVVEDFYLVISNKEVLDQINSLILNTNDPYKELFIKLNSGDRAVIESMWQGQKRMWKVELSNEELGLQLYQRPNVAGKRKFPRDYYVPADESDVVFLVCPAVGNKERFSCQANMAFGDLVHVNFFIKRKDLQKLPEFSELIKELITGFQPVAKK